MVYAQTNLQLYSQMRAAGYSEPALVTVHQAHNLAVQLFTAKFRASGKPLLSHLVGTSSVVCAVGGRAELIAAALLHAAYIFGEFGDGRAGMTPAKRAHVRQAVGAEIESLVARYHDLDWRQGTIESLHARLDSMTADEREILLVRLANELEDHLDLGVLYCGNAAERRDLIAGPLGLAIDMACRIDQPLLVSELRRVFDEVLAADVPDALRLPRDYTYMRPPLSFMMKPAVSLRRLVDRHPRLARLLHAR
jgi:hypothetical protein